MYDFARLFIFTACCLSVLSKTVLCDISTTFPNQTSKPRAQKEPPFYANAKNKFVAVSYPYLCYYYRIHQSLFLQLDLFSFYEFQSWLIFIVRVSLSYVEPILRYANKSLLSLYILFLPDSMSSGKSQFSF